MKLFRTRSTFQLRRRYSWRREEWQQAWYRLRHNRLALVGVGVIVFLLGLTVLAPFVAPHPGDATGATHVERKLEPPSAEYWFGTDNIGRDILSRVIFGTRSAFLLGVLVLAVAIGLGVPLGLIAGYYGSGLGAGIMRVAEVFLSLPPVVLALAITSAIGASLENAIIAVAFVWWPWYTRLVNGEVLSLKEEQFVEASRLVGASRLRIAFKELLPNVVTLVSVKGTLDMGFAILVGATISFLGLGAQEPVPDWGYMMSISRQFLPAHWWMTAFPGFAIFLTVLGFNLLGDGLRDVLEVEVR